MKSYKTEISKIFVFAATHSSFICTLFVPFFKDSGINPLQISILFMIKKSARIFFDIPFGMLYDKLNPKIVFFTGRLIKLFSFLMLLREPTFFTLSIAMLFDGISYSAIYGKINVHIYNVLKIFKKKELYVKVFSIYYGLVDISLAIIGFTSAYLFKKGGYDLVIKASIIGGILTFVSIFFIPDIKKSSKARPKKISFDLIQAIQEVYSFFKSRYYFRLIIFFYAFINFFAWNFGPIASMILLDMGYSTPQLSIISSLCKFASLIGIIIPFVVNFVSIKNTVRIIIPSTLFMLISAISYNKELFIFSMIYPLFFYSMVEGNLERFVDREASVKIRATINSCSSFLTTLIAVLINVAFGFVSHLFSVKIGFQIIIILLSIYIGYCIGLFYFKYRRFEKFN